MRQPLAVARPGGVFIIVVDRMGITRHLRKVREFRISNSTSLARKRLPYAKIIRKELRWCRFAHFCDESSARTTTGRILRVRSG